jgi:hypothetical protein
MKNTLFVLFCIFFAHQVVAQTEVDDNATLRWVQRHADSIEATLTQVAKVGDRYDLLVKIAHAYELFDAVVLVSPYCNEARMAALAGKHETNLIQNLTKSTDASTLVLRATEALAQAKRMKAAASGCIEINVPSNQKICLIEATIKNEAHFVELDLQDGLASGNFHLLGQKIDHAQVVMYQMEEVTRSCQQCTEVRWHLIRAQADTERALKAVNWVNVKFNLSEAIIHLQSIQKLECKPE